MFSPYKINPCCIFVQVNDSEIEPLIILKNGSNKGNDNFGPKDRIWALNKDLHA